MTYRFPVVRAAILRSYRSRYLDVVNMLDTLYEEGRVRPWDAVALQDPEGMKRYHAFLYSFAASLFAEGSTIDVIVDTVRVLRKLVKDIPDDGTMPGWFVHTDRVSMICDHREFGTFLQSHLEHEQCITILCFPIRHLWNDFE